MLAETVRMMDESDVRVWWGGWWVRDWERGESSVFEQERMSETEEEKKKGRNIILTRGGNKKYYLLLVHYKNFSYTTTKIAYFL